MFSLYAADGGGKKSNQPEVHEANERHAISPAQYSVDVSDPANTYGAILGRSVGCHFCCHLIQIILSEQSSSSSPREGPERRTETGCPSSWPAPTHEAGTEAVLESPTDVTVGWHHDLGISDLYRRTVEVKDASCAISPRGVSSPCLILRWERRCLSVYLFECRAVQVHIRRGRPDPTPPGHASGIF